MKLRLYKGYGYKATINNFSTDKPMLDLNTMKSAVIFLMAVLFTLSGCTYRALEEVNSLSEPMDIEAPKELGIDEAIKLQKNQKQRNILSQFRNQYQIDDHITVQEYEDHWEIIVDHPDTDDGFTGGAESYKVHKQTGKSEMIWHEHPMEIEEGIEEKE